MNFNFWKRRDEELDEELRFHLQMAIRERVERGEDPRAAERAARREFGNLALVRETTRGMWGLRWLEDAWQDTRYALRGMRNQPGFTAAAVISLALGIGANTAIFSLTYNMLLRPLPVARPGELVELLQKYPGEPRANGSWSQAAFAHYRESAHSFSALFGASIDNRIKLQTTGGDVEYAIGEYVTPNYFPELGLRAADGRLLGAEAADVVVISWALWNRGVRVGDRLLAFDKPHLVVGVAPRSYEGLRVEARVDLWLPLRPDQRMAIIGRIRPGATISQARAEMAALYRFTIEERAAKTTDPKTRQLQVEVEYCGTGLRTVRDRFGKPVTVLFAVVAVLLLLACANLAGLLLARGAARAKEMALRRSLGAGRGRLVRQVLTESLLLSVLGTAAGIAVAYFGVEALLRILGSARPHEKLELTMHLDGTVLLFTAGIAVATGLLFGMAPAWSALRPAGRPGRVGRALLAGQVALSMFLLSAAGLFVAQLAELKTADLGFRRDHILLASLDPSRNQIPRDKVAAVYQDLLTRVEAIPGVRTASMGGPTPLHGAGASGFGAVSGTPEDKRWISISWVAPRYFEALGMPLLSGRDFTLHDQANPLVAIINRTLARQYFGDESPLGKHITMSNVTMTREPATYEIIGVAGDANYYEIREAERRAIFFPSFRNGRSIASILVVRTEVAPESVAAEVSRAAGGMVERVTTLEAQIDSSIVLERMMAMLSGFFGGVGALLAGIGVYGLLAYTVARRTSEIGVRMALGATARQMAALVLREALAVVLAGLAVGVPLAVWGHKAVVALMPEAGRSAVTPMVFGVAALAAVAMAAAYLPARRAARVDPMTALRRE